MEICAASDEVTIKRDGNQYVLFVSGSEVDRNSQYDPLAKMSTEIHMSRCAAKGDEFLGRRMFAPADIGPSGPVVVVAKAKSGGYVVQRCGTGDRFEVLPEFLSEMPTEYFR